MQTLDAKYLKETVLEGFSLVDLGVLAGEFVLREFDREAVIFRQESKAAWVYLLLSGAVQIVYQNEGEETIVAIVRPGEFFGLDAFSVEARQSFGATALEKCTVGVIRARTMIETLLKVPHENYRSWDRGALAPLRAMHMDGVRSVRLGLRRRMANVLLQLADRFGSSHPRGVRIDLRVTHEMLAAMVGGARQQITAYLNDFDREGWITRDGRRIIVDPERLRQV